MSATSDTLPRRHPSALPLAIAGLAALAFGLLAWLVSYSSALVAWDGRVIVRVTDSVRDHPLLIDVLQVLSALGGRIVLTVVVTVAAVWHLRHGRGRAAAFVVITVILGNGLNLMLKAIFERTRPVIDEAITQVAGYSFPSGHAMNSTVAYGAVVLAALPFMKPSLRPWVIAGASILVLVIGATRVLLGVHFPTDVIAGFFAGIAWLSVCYAIFRIGSTSQSS